MKEKILQLIKSRFEAITNLEAKLIVTRQNSQFTLAPVHQKGAIKYLAPRSNASMLVRVDLKDPKQTVSISNYGYTIYSPKLIQALRGSSGSDSKNARYAELFRTIFRLPSEFEKEYKTVYIGKTTINGGDPAYHLMFTPNWITRLPISDLNNQTIELWVDMTGMPVQMKTNEANSSITLFLSKIRTNKKIMSSKFDVKLAKGTKIVREDPPVFAATDLLVSTDIRNRPIPRPSAPRSGGSVIIEILRRMEAHNKALTSLRANIVMVRTNAQLRVNDTSRGMIAYVAGRGNRRSFRADFDNPLETIVLINQQWISYRPNLAQARTGTINSRNRRVLAFLSMSRAELQTNYNVTFMGEETVTSGAKTWRLEFTPRDLTTFKSADVWVDGNGMPVQSRVVEHNHDSTTVLLSNLQKNITINLSAFNVDLPKGTKIIKS